MGPADALKPTKYLQLDLKPMHWMPECPNRLYVSYALPSFTISPCRQVKGAVAVCFNCHLPVLLCLLQRGERGIAGRYWGGGGSVARPDPDGEGLQHQGAALHVQAPQCVQVEVHLSLIHI